MATASDVAKLAGVSQSTVSYVMSGTRTISPETRARVEAAMRKLSYHPNAGARALAGSRTNVIGLMTRFTASTEVGALLPFIDTVTGYSRERDYDVVIVTADEGPAGLERLAGRAIVDAIVLMDIRRNDDRVQTARDLDIPVVLIGIPDDVAGLDCVDFDVAGAGRLAVEELVATGSSRILLIGEPPEVRAQSFGFVNLFADSVQDAAKNAGVAFDLFEPGAEGWSGFDDFALLIDELHRGGTGIVARTPQTIDMTMQLLLSHGVIPGRDVSLVGLCPDAAAEALRIPVTNVSPEPRDVSQLAMETLFARLGGSNAPHEVRIVSPRLTRRATTNAVRA